jgi:hypothetical protein
MTEEKTAPMMIAISKKTVIIDNVSFSLMLKRSLPVDPY